MTSITVTTKEQLDDARKAGMGEILVEGALAVQLHKTRKLATVGAAGLAALAAASAGVLMAPATMGVSAGLSFAVAAPVAAFTGLELATVIAVVALGAAVVIAVWKDYEEVEFDAKALKMKLRKKRSNRKASK